MLFFRACLAALLLAIGMVAQATSLQISPVTVTMHANENASGITLFNPGNVSLYGQIRVFRWDQTENADTLTPTQDLVASPPLLRIPAQTEQLVRLVHIAKTPGAVEQSYRMLIDELPTPDETGQSGVKIRLRYSVPIFILPATSAGKPSLIWHLLQDRKAWYLKIDNTGAQHAQISAISISNAEHKEYEISQGLLGYVLAGHQRRWKIHVPVGARLTGKLTLQATVNTQPIHTVLNVGS
jgi:fimbrial chaperone protein